MYRARQCGPRKFLQAASLARRQFFRGGMQSALKADTLNVDQTVERTFVTISLPTPHLHLTSVEPVLHRLALTAGAVTSAISRHRDLCVTAVAKQV